MAITRKLQKNTEITSFTGAIPLDYKYTMGVAGEEFFRALKNKGAFLASTCPECGFTYMPSRIFCERCFTRCESTFNAGQKGTLLSYTVSFEDFKGNPLDTPEYFGLIRIHGTDTVIIHRLNPSDPDCLCIEGEVKAVMSPKKDRKGSITDIKYFTSA